MKKKTKNTSSDKNAAEETKTQRPNPQNQIDKNQAKVKQQRSGKQDTYAVEEVQYNPKPNIKKQCRKSSKQKITTKIKTKQQGKINLRHASRTAWTT